MKLKRVFKKLIKKETKIWHQHFIPSLIAGVGVAVVALFFKLNVPNVILFSSIGASAIILAHNDSHHLTKLHTALLSYFTAVIISLILLWINSMYEFHWAVNLFFVVFLVSIAMYLIDSVHPPAVSAALAFVLFEGKTLDLIYLFLSIMALLVFIRFISYTISSNLSIKKFLHEFKKEFS
jgi:CBS-domain-containing membrane protein